jgi:hypothetical protein
MHIGVVLGMSVVVMMALLPQHDVDEAGVRACRAGTVLLHYLLLVALSWMLVEGYHINSLFGDLFGALSEFPWRSVSLGCYLVPAAIAAITAGVHWDEYGHTEDTGGLCWLPDRRGARWAFYAPLLAVMVVNTCYLGRALYNIHLLNTRSNRKVSSSSLVEPQAPVHPVKILLQASVSFFTALGLFWPLLLLALSSHSAVLFQTLLAAIILVHAGCMFVFHAAADPAVREALAAWIGGQSLGAINRQFLTMADSSEDQQDFSSRTMAPNLYTLRPSMMTLRHRGRQVATPATAATSVFPGTAAPPEEQQQQQQQQQQQVLSNAAKIRKAKAKSAVRPLSAWSAGGEPDSVNSQPASQDGLLDDVNLSQFDARPVSYAPSEFLAYNLREKPSRPSSEMIALADRPESLFADLATQLAASLHELLDANGAPVGGRPMSDIPEGEGFLDSPERPISLVSLQANGDQEEQEEGSLMEDDDEEPVRRESVGISSRAQRDIVLSMFEPTPEEAPPGTDTATRQQRVRFNETADKNGSGASRASRGSRRMLPAIPSTNTPRKDSGASQASRGSLRPRPADDLVDPDLKGRIRTASGASRASHRHNKDGGDDGDDEVAPPPPPRRSRASSENADLAEVMRAGRSSSNGAAEKPPAPAPRAASATMPATAALSGTDVYIDLAEQSVAELGAELGAEVEDPHRLLYLDIVTELRKEKVDADMSDTAKRRTIEKLRQRASKRLQPKTPGKSPHALGDNGLGGSRNSNSNNGNGNGDNHSDSNNRTTM